MRLTDRGFEDLDELEDFLDRCDEAPEDYSVAVEGLIFDEKFRWILMERGEACRDEVGKLEGIGGGYEYQDRNFVEGLKREIREEAGEEAEIEVLDSFEVRKDRVEDLEQEEERNWIIVSFICLLKSGQLEIREPEKNRGFHRLNFDEFKEEELSSSAKSAYSSLQKEWEEVKEKIIESQQELRVPEDARRDFVAGCLIIQDGKLLLIDHGKYDMWLAPGGHVEERETPDETAKRETLEETGFEVELKHSSGVVEEEFIDIPRPFNVNLHKIEEGHWHCDYLYLAEIVEEKEASHGYEHDGMRWFSVKDLENEEYDIPEYMREAGKRAILSLEG
jgi:ADP-ribose pyrophosphatase YjhB (NUDIX family)